MFGDRLLYHESYAGTSGKNSALKGEMNVKRDTGINRRLRAILRLNGISAAEAARRCGMSYESFYRAVSGLRPIYADELSAFAAAADTDPLRLLGWSGC